MKRWIGLAAIILILTLFFLWQSPSANTKSSSSSSSSIPVNTPPPLRESASAARTARPLPVELRPGASGKRAIIIKKTDQNIEEEARKRDEILVRYRAPALRENEPFDRLRLRAVEKSRFDPSMGVSVGELLDYVLIESHSTEAPLTAGESLPVVSSKSNGRLGIVTGTIIVTLREASLANAIGQNYGLDLRYEDKPARQVYYSAISGTPLDQVVAALAADQGVESARLEVVQGKKKFQ